MIIIEELDIMLANFKEEHKRFAIICMNTNSNKELAKIVEKRCGIEEPEDSEIAFYKGHKIKIDDSLMDGKFVLEESDKD